MRKLPLLLPLVVLAGIALSGCSEPSRPYVNHGYIRLSAVPRRPAVAYFTLHGGKADATLIAVGTQVAIKTEMHQSMMHGNMASMKPLDHLAVPAGAAVTFAPGGRHVMIFDLNPGITAGKTMTLRFTFADGRRVESDLKVIAPGAPAPTE